MPNRKVIQKIAVKQRAHRKHHTPFVFVGAGHLGGAVIKSLVSQKIYAKRDIFVITNTEASAKQWKRWGVSAAARDYSILKNAKEVWLAVKPFQLRDVCVAMRPYLNSKTKILSLLAGWKPSSLQELFGVSSVASIMTNTSARVNAGMFALFYSDKATQVMAKKLLPRFKKLGFVCGTLHESQMPQVTALVGSAPAFYLNLQMQYINYAHKNGLSVKQASQWFEALTNSCAKIAESEVDLDLLIQQIATPGGCTEQGLLVLQETNSLFAALVSCASRAKALGA